MTDVAQLTARITAAETLLREAQEQFRHYGKQHRAKVPALQKLAGAGKQIADTEAKAAVNEEFDRRIGRFLSEAWG